MTYLYGDSTPSELRTNFLEFLRDAIDFSVFVLQADDRIRRGIKQAKALTQEADSEKKRLDGFIHLVSRTIDEADKGAAESPTADCASHLLVVVADQHRSAVAGVERRLADELAQIDAEEVEAREACVRALGSLLLGHDSPDASAVTSVALAEDGTKYTAKLDGRAEFGLEWTIELSIPDGNLWAAPIQISRITPQLEIHAPQLTGWISKEVKVKPQRLERHLVTELVDDGVTMKLKLRPELGSPLGFDLEIGPEPNVVRAVRLGPSDDASVGAFEPAAEDIAALVDVASKLRAAATDFTRKALVNATTGGSDFYVQPVFAEVVERLIAMMAPIVRELSRRSLSETELIMRRPLANDRREEIFVAKTTLREKYGVLTAIPRALFAPLGLDLPSADSAPPSRGAKPASVPPPLPPAPPEEAPVRAELPPSQPPPPPRTAPITSIPWSPKSVMPRMGALPPARPPPRRPPPSVSPPTPLPPAASPPLPSVPPPLPSVPPLPPPSAPYNSRPPPAETTDAPSIEVSVDEAGREELPSEPPTGEIDVEALAPKAPSVEPPAAASVAPPKAASVAPPKPPSIAPPIDGSNHGAEELVAALKKILTLSRAGQVDDAYREYAALYSDDTFLAYRPEEQRQALRLMVIQKAKPTSSDAVIEAHRAALARIETLTESHNDAGDYELLGVAHLVLDDVESARAAFTTALAIERARNPQSELVGTLMKRVSEI